jgi:hypothetical protein
VAQAGGRGGSFRSRLGETSSRGPVGSNSAAPRRRSSLSPFAGGGDSSEGNGDRRIGGRQVGGGPSRGGFGGGRPGGFRGAANRGPVPRSAPRKREERPQGYDDLDHDDQMSATLDPDAIFGGGPAKEPGTPPATDAAAHRPAPRRTFRKHTEG